MFYWEQMGKNNIYIINKLPFISVLFPTKSDFLSQQRKVRIMGNKP